MQEEHIVKPPCKCRPNYLQPPLFRRYLSDLATRQHSRKIAGTLLRRSPSQKIKQQSPHPPKIFTPSQDLCDLVKTLLDTGKIVLRIELRHAAKAPSRRKAKSMEESVPEKVSRTTSQHARNPDAPKERPNK